MHGIAGAVSITIPIIILVYAFQKQIVAGMTAGAVKGLAGWHGHLIQFRPPGSAIGELERQANAGSPASVFKGGSTTRQVGESECPPKKI